MNHPHDTPVYRFGKTDGYALLALGLLFCAALLASWQRWTQPLLELKLAVKSLEERRADNEYSFPGLLLERR